MNLTTTRRVRSFIIWGMVIILAVIGRLVLAENGAIIFEKTIATLVGIDTDKGYGSGFIVNDMGDVVTNYHVVRGSTYIKIWSEATKKFYKKKDISVKSVDPVHDLAILHISNFEGFPPDKQRARKTESTEETSIVKNGTDVYALGYPLVKTFEDHSFSRGNISGDSNAATLFGNRFTDKTKNEYKLLRFDANTEVGSSGGMLLNSEGYVVAVTTGAVGNKYAGFAVPIEYVNRLLAITPEAGDPSLNYSWEEHDIEGDKYYTSTLYAENKETGDNFTISANVLEKNTELPIINAQILVEIEGQDDKEYKRLKLSNDKGYYELKLPVFTDQQWYLTVSHEDYKKTKQLGPFRAAEDFPKTHFMNLRDSLQKKMDGKVRALPSRIGLNLDKGHIDYKATIRLGKKRTNEIADWKISTSIPEWLKVDPPSGPVQSGKDGAPIDFYYRNEVNLPNAKTAKTYLKISAIMNDIKLPDELIWVYADKLPAEHGLRVSGHLRTEGNREPMADIPIYIGATVDGHNIEDFEATPDDSGRFETFIHQKYKKNNANIKLTIQSEWYTVDNNDPRLIINNENDWHTMIILKKLE